MCTWGIAQWRIVCFSFVCECVCCLLFVEMYVFLDLLEFCVINLTRACDSLILLREHDTQITQCLSPYTGMHMRSTQNTYKRKYKGTQASIGLHTSAM